ncbi:MAG: metallophosphoesterase [Anaerolineales bacterium]|nr:metallophosphoesterase [Anaerolineales bacterium]
MKLSGRILIEQPTTDVTDGRFHRVMLFFQRPVNWPNWMLAMAISLLAISTGSIYWLVGADPSIALAVTALQFIFFLVDVAILLALPLRGISFGDWRAQFFPLAIPRTAAALVLGLIGLFFGWLWALILILLVQIAAAAVLYYATHIEPTRLGLTHLRLTSDRLVPGTPPLRIMHITDIHVERLTKRENQILQMVEKAQPDLIVLTGDYVNLSYNEDRETYKQVRVFLSRLSAPYGIYATLGTPPVDLRDWVAPLFDGLPITLMREESQKIELGRGRRLYLVGMDCTHDIPTDAARLKRIMKTVNVDAPQVLLYHSPELMPQASEHEIDLYLCGHTHGGQVRLPFIGPLLTSSQLGRQYVMGLYHNGRTQLYVSRGVGLEGLSAPRVRFLTPPEITLVTLRPA